MDLVDSYDGLRPMLAVSIVSSVTMTLAGFALGCSFGAGLGLVMAYSRLVRELLGGIFDFIRPVPVFALIPLFVLWFGIGWFPGIALITLGTSVLLGVTTLEAIKNVPSVYVKAALTLGASRSQIYRTVIVPSILPHLLGAIRVAAAASWGLDVAAEFIGAQNGLGYLMVTREQYLDTAGIILICLIYCVLAISMDRVIRSIQAPMLAWSERSSSGVVGSIVGND
jgi:ABC-type nitrate/sulfonate/bicarbonate transport system permease component